VPEMGLTRGWGGKIEGRLQVVPGGPGGCGRWRQSCPSLVKSGSQETGVKDMVESEEVAGERGSWRG
jgi:hypothetical protein